MKNLARMLIVLIVLFAAFAFGFTWKDLRSGSAPSQEAIGRLIGRPEATAKVTATQEFSDAFHRIIKDYYRPIDQIDLKWAGMEGAMGSLGDPHTQYMEPKIAREFAQDTRGNFVGVGARLAPDPLGAKVATVFKDGPAARSGLRPGDLITKVDGNDVAGQPVDKIVSQIRGKEGTEVRLTVVRANADKAIDLKIRRAMVYIPTAEGQVIPDTEIGIINVAQFSETTVEQFDSALDELTDKKIKGLVVDLRSNPGGLLKTAVMMLSNFKPDSVVVKMRYRDGTEEVHRTESNRSRRLEYPVVVLVNEESASAAEIFAGVMQDYRLATIVGEHTYGKASVQNVFQLIDGASAKITIARYYLPNGSDISRKVDVDGEYVSGGLKPDVRVPANIDLVPGVPKTDNQLQKAIEIIQSKSASGTRAFLVPPKTLAEHGTAAVTHADYLAMDA
ncbi:MAG: hypothetical protein HONBIEJF_01312 [Fimbriimonadaceae bacterium]|nr:hypothetical protein [Fimbriimonadaceae bacterium]